MCAIQDNKFATHRRAVFKADTRSGERVAVRAYMLGNGFDCDKAANEVIRLRYLSPLAAKHLFWRLKI